MINFLHIAKCGGSSMRNSIQQALANPNIATADKVTIYVYGRQFALGDHNLHPDDLGKFSSQVSPSLVKAIVGHYSYSSLSSYLGHTDTFCTTFTLVRDPIQRAISNINYIKLRPAHRAYKHFKSINPENLYDYLVDAGRSRLGSYQLNALLLSSEIAAQNLSLEQRIALVHSRIAVYRVESSMLALKNHLSVLSDSVGYQRLNQSRQVAGKPSCPSADDAGICLVDYGSLTLLQLERLRDIYKDDYALWQSAR